MNIFKKLDKLAFPFGEYVVCGSGILAALGLREAKDLDIAVNSVLLKKLLSGGKYDQQVKYGKLFLVRDKIEIITQLNWEQYATTVDTAIKTAAIINGFPFLNIKETIKFKKALGREKDFNDIKLLEEYLKTH